MLHGSLRGPFSRTRGAPGPAPTQAETTSWQAVVVTNGGTVSAARFTVVNNFIAAEKAAGTWALTDDYWGLWAENAPQALTSLKQLRLATVVAAPAFTADRGYVFDGTTQYINTGFVPSTHAVAMTGTNLRVAVYERTNVDASTVAAGTTLSSSAILWNIPRVNVNLVGRINCTGQASFGLPVADSRGYSVLSINGTLFSNTNGYKNGMALVLAGSGTMGSGLATAALFIGAANNAGPALIRASALGLVAIGAALTPAQEAAQYSCVQAWATAVGAQV
jgi:hypothetical protein